MPRLAEVVRCKVGDETARPMVLACLAAQRELRPECGWLVVEDFAGTGRTVLVPELPAVHPAAYEPWPWSALAGFQRTRRELKALGFDQAEAR